MDDSSRENPEEGFLKQSLNNRWVWLAICLLLLGTSGFVLAQGVRQNIATQSQIVQAQKELSSNQDLVKRSDQLKTSLVTCKELVATRIQQLDAFKSSLSVISTEYQNMFHAGIRNVNVDSYIEALNSVASITAVLDGQNLGACNAN